MGHTGDDARHPPGRRRGPPALQSHHPDVRRRPHRVDGHPVRLDDRRHRRPAAAHEDGNRPRPPNDPAECHSRVRSGDQPLVLRLGRPVPRVRHALQRLWITCGRNSVRQRPPGPHRHGRAGGAGSRLIRRDTQGRRRIAGRVSERRRLAEPGPQNLIGLSVIVVAWVAWNFYAYTKPPSIELSNFTFRVSARVCTAPIWHWPTSRASRWSTTCRAS